MTAKATFYRITIVVALLPVLLGIFIIAELQSNDKSTARITASFRYSSTLHPAPINGQNENNAIGYDPYAQYFALQSVSWIFSSPVLRWIFYAVCKYILPMYGTMGHVVGRHFIIDKVLYDEINENNAKQLVIFGAGFDSRSIRFQDLFVKHNVSVFEVDLKTTQFDKKSLLSQNNIDIPPYLTFIETDFQNDNIKELLQQNGYNPTRQTVFIFEGVSPYIKTKDVSDVMNVVSQFSGLNSLIVWDLNHRCIGYALGLYEYKFEKYCQETGMQNSLLRRLYKLSFVQLLKEPMYFSIDWDVHDETSTKHNLNSNGIDYHHVLDFHNDHCLKTERIYNFDELQSFFEWKESDRILLDVPPGLAVASARHVDIDCAVKYV